MAKTARQGVKRAAMSRAGRVLSGNAGAGERVARTPRGTVTAKPAPDAPVSVKGITPEMMASAARIQVTADKKSGRATEEWIVKLAKTG